MRKSLKKKQARTLRRAWMLRLILGLILSYLAAYGVLCLFHSRWGEDLMNVGFLCVFSLMPVLLLLLFSLPPRRRPDTMHCLVLLGVLLGWTC